MRRTKSLRVYAKLSPNGSMRRMKSLRVCAKFLPNGLTYSMRRMKSLRVCAKFSPNGSMRRMKSLRVCAKFSPNGLTYLMRRLKSLRVYAKFSPSARYGFKNWKTLCPKLARGDLIVSDSGQHSVPHRTRWRALSDASSFERCAIPTERPTPASPSRVWDVSCTWRCPPSLLQADLSRGG